MKIFSIDAEWTRVVLRRRQPRKETLHMKKSLLALVVLALVFPAGAGVVACAMRALLEYDPSSGL